MSEEKQPEQELSAEELQEAAGGYSWGVTNAGSMIKGEIKEGFIFKAGGDLSAKIVK